MPCRCPSFSGLQLPFLPCRLCSLRFTVFSFQIRCQAYFNPSPTENYKPKTYLISLCSVTFLRNGLYFFRSIRAGVFFRFFVVMYRDIPGTPLSFCSVHSRITWILLAPFFAIANVRFLDKERKGTKSLSLSQYLLKKN